MRYAPLILATLLATSPMAMSADTTQPAAPATQPTKVTLHIDANRSQEAITQIGEQLGLRFQSSGQQIKRPFKFDATDQPFASAVSNLLQAVAMAPANNYSEPTLMDGAPLRVVPVNDTAALLIARTTVQASMPLRARQGMTNYSYNVQMTLVTDPALKIIKVGQNMVPDALDYDGTPWRRDNGFYFENGMGQMNLSAAPLWTVSVNFNSQQAATLIKRLAGKIRCWQVAEEATADIDIADIATPKVIQGKLITAEIVSDDNNGQNTITVRIKGPGAALYADPQWQNQMRGVVQAVDVDGKALPMVSNDMQINPADKSVTVRLSAQGQNMDEVMEKLATLHVRLPTKMRSVDIPFEVTDLPLP